jgi:conjugal transfer pilus assembly protein TraA
MAPACAIVAPDRTVLAPNRASVAPERAMPALACAMLAPARANSGSDRKILFQPVARGRATACPADAMTSTFALDADRPRLIGREPPMEQALKQSGRSVLMAVAILAVAVALLMMPGPAFAGADTTFDTALTQFSGFLEGSGGKIITVLSLAGGIVGLASGRFSLGQVAIPVGVGVGAGTGIPIVTSTVTATI